MPRIYNRKKPAPTYTLEDLQNAVADVSTNNLTYRQASARYGVPVSNIFNRIKGRKIAEGKVGSGRKCELQPHVEDDIAKCLEERAKMGYPCSKDELLQLIQNYVLENKIKTRFKDGKPGHDWYIGFMARHPRLSLKKPEHLQKSRKTARNPDVVYDFYDKLENIVSTYNVLPSFIYNADESGFSSDPSKIRAIGTKGEALSRISGGSGRENTTVLACVAADGTVLPPMIVFKGAAVQARWTSPAAFPGTVYAASRNGWMEEPQFFSWFQTSFISHIFKRRVDMKMSDATALLLYDGHASHISLRILQAAIEGNIQIIKFPSHLTDMIQPLDKCVFGPVKKAWDRKLVEFGKDSIGMGTGRLQKRDFVEMLSLVWTEAITEKNVLSGFSSTGIWPVNRARFPEAAFESHQLAAYKRRKVAADIAEDRGTLMPENNAAGSSASPVPEVAEAPIAQVAEVQIAGIVEIPTTQVVEIPTAEIVEIPADQIIKVPEIEIVEVGSVTPTVAEIFAAAIREKKLSVNVAEVVKKPTPRLKQLQYGEVLTTEQVVARLQEAEQKKATANAPKKKAKTTPAKMLKKIAQKKKVSIISSSEESEEEISLHDDSDDSKIVSSHCSSEDEMDTSISQLRNTGTTIDVGAFIVVKFVYNANSKKEKEKHFIGQVVTTEGEAISAKFMRKSSKTEEAYLFPRVDDIQDVAVGQILANVKPNKIVRGRHFFPDAAQFNCS